MQLLVGLVQERPAKSQKSPRLARQSSLLRQLVRARLQTPPQSFVLVQDLAGSLEQTRGRRGHSELRLHPPGGVVPKAQLPPELA
jgi:hypothetical protein